MQHFVDSLPCHSPEPYPPHLRIADILPLHEDDGDGEQGGIIGTMNGFRRRHQGETCGFGFSSPRRIVSMLFRRRKERRRLVSWKGEIDEESADGQSACLSSLPLDAKETGGYGGSAVAIGKSDESGSCGKGGVFNMGVACSLLYLLASTKDELSKMNDLRTDMEILLQNVKEEAQRKDSVSDTLLSEESPAASCLTNLKEVSSCSSSLILLRSTTVPYLSKGEESIDISSRSIVYDESRKESVEGMEQLEAELQAELELLQLQLDNESSAQSMKITDNDSIGKSTDCLSLGEVIDPNEAPTQAHVGGVPPIELERKLHELLESRQEERIKELEAALECLKRRLSEKESEAMWWKDTALLVSEHVPGPLGRSWKH